MKLLIGGQYYPTLDAQSISIQRSATDPVPTCTLNLIDNTSSLSIQSPSEIIILDDNLIPNPAFNLIQNPTFNPYNSLWNNHNGTGFVQSQNPGGGLIWTFSNTTLFNQDGVNAQQTINGIITPGVTYMLSCTIQGGSSPTNIGAMVSAVFVDASGNNLGSPINILTAVPIPTTATRYTASGVAPAGAVAVNIGLLIQVSSSTNSGTITFTNAQLEPEWFPTMAYPSPFCGPSQTNCRQLPLGFWIRQYRKFAGFVNHPVAQNYHGNVRTLQINAVGYAWLLSLAYGNDSFSSQTDAAIMTSLVNKYLQTPSFIATLSSFDMVSTANVVTGQTLTSVQLNWDDLRTIFDNLAGMSTFYWNIDDYWNLNYAPPGYFAQGIGLICDDSSNPDNVTTFPGYEFSAEADFTQPGAAVLVIGSGSNVSLVYDPSRVAQLSQISGYYLPLGSSWMRKINDSTLGNTTDTTNRGIAELLLYRYPRNIYHVKTNVELIPGQSIQVTSATEGLSAATLLVQQTTATWLGTNELLQDEWEYQSDLGATNRRATHMISRIFRQTQQNTSAPAISVTTLSVGEVMGLAESIGIGTLVSNYAQSILPDGPSALYPLGEMTGTIADDASGNAYQGTLHGGVTLGATGLLTDAADSSATAMTFNGSTGYIQLPTAFVPTGAHAWSLECWCNPAGLPGGVSTVVMVNMGTATTGEWAALDINNNGTNTRFDLSIFGTEIRGTSTPVIGTTYHVVGAYDGTNLRLYVNGSLVAGPTAAAVNLVVSYASIGAEGNGLGGFFNGTIQYPGFYNTTLSATQAATHFAAGTSYYAYTVMQDTPLRYYRLNEPSGTTANDTSGNSQAGTINGGVTLNQTGLLFNDAGKSMAFNGTTGYISLPTTSLPTGASAWTLECWCKITAFPGSGNAALVAFGSDVHLEYASLKITSANQFVCSLFSADIIYSGISTATLYHVVGTYDGTNLRLYVNGALVAGPTAFADNIVLTYATIARGSGSAEFYNGVLQEVALYNTALSATRIQAHYNVGTTGHL